MNFVDSFVGVEEKSESSIIRRVDINIHFCDEKSSFYQFFMERKKGRKNINKVINWKFSLDSTFSLKSIAKSIFLKFGVAFY